MKTNLKDNYYQVIGYPNLVITNSGWSCPKCGAVNAPWVAQCPCIYNLGTYITSTSTTITEES